MPKYRKQIIGVAGPLHKGMRNLRPFRSKEGGGVEQSPEPLFVESYYWKSVQKYHDKSLSNQVQSMLTEFQSWIGHINAKNIDVAYNALIPTFAKAKMYCPLDPDHRSGEPLALRASARLEKRTTGGGKPTVEISFGRNGVPFYAVFVHEMLRYRHAPPTRAKFLETAIKEDMAVLQDRVVVLMKDLAGTR